MKSRFYRKLRNFLTCLICTLVAHFATQIRAADIGDYALFPSAGATTSVLIKIGTVATDDESASQTNATATADDLSSADDEDGVTWPALIKGGGATITVRLTNQSPGNAYLSGWIDFNHNGVLTDTGEQIVINDLIPPATIGLDKSFTFTVPGAAFKGSVGARFRFSSISGAGSTGTVGTGEVEDYVVELKCPDILIAPTTLPSGYINTAYYQTITAFLGEPSYTWSIVSGTLPSGLSLQTPSQPFVGTGTTYPNVFTPSGSVTVDPPNGGLLTISLGGSAGPSDVGIWSLRATGGASLGVLGLGILETGAQTQVTGSELKFNMSNNQGSLLGALGIGTSITATWQADATFDKPGAVLQLKPSSTYNITFYVDGHNGLLQSGLGIVPTFSAEFLDGAGNPLFSTSSGTLINLLGLLGTGVTSGNITLSFRTPATLPAGSPTVRFKGGAILNTTVLGLGKTFATISGLAIAETDTHDSSNPVIIGTPTQTETQVITIRAVDYYGCEAQTNVTITILPLLDFGDLPAPYATTLAHNGPRHTVTGGFCLGAANDVDPDGLPAPAADGDGADDDGISFPEFIAGEPASITYSVTNTAGLMGKLHAWIDWNHDGDFNDAQEQIAMNLPADSSGSIPVLVPANAVTDQPLGARFRLSSASGLQSVGAAADGEVEDYVITVISSLSLGNLVWNDANENGHFDAGEFGIHGVTLELYSSTDAIEGNADDQLIATVSSDGLGLYLFGRLHTGLYYVRFLPPAAFPLASDGAETSDNQMNHDNNGAQPGGQGTFVFSPIIALAPGTESITDGDGDYNSEMTVDFALHSCPGIVVSPPVLPPGNVNSAYTEALQATGGSGAYSFMMVGGALPVGLSLNAAGVISGVPTAAGTFPFLARATDTHGCVGELEVSVTIRPLPVIHASAKDAEGRYLLGGEFYEVNGIARKNLVRLNRDGTVDLTFEPAPPNGAIHCITYRQGEIYAGGSFTTWGGATQHLLVKLDSMGSRDTAFAGNVLSANSGDAVYAISESGFYVCGKFNTPTNGIAALDPSTGLALPTFTTTGPESGATLYDVKYDGSRIVVAGNFATFAGTSRSGIAALTTTGTFDAGWPASSAVDGAMRCLMLLAGGSDLISVGDFGQYGTTSGLNGVARMHRSSGILNAGFAGGDSSLILQRINKVTTP